MYTKQIFCTLRNVRSFLGDFPSDLLPQSFSQSGKVVINADPHTEKFSHWLAILSRPKSASTYYFDSYGFLPVVPDFQAFVRRNSTASDHNRRHLQGLTSNIFGNYCCLFALYTVLGYTPQQFVGLFDAEVTDGQTDRLFASEFGPLLPSDCGSGGQCSSSFYKT